MAKANRMATFGLEKRERFIAERAAQMQTMLPAPLQGPATLDAFRSALRLAWVEGENSVFDFARELASFKPGGNG